MAIAKLFTIIQRKRKLLYFRKKYINIYNMRKIILYLSIIALTSSYLSANADELDYNGVVDLYQSSPLFEQGFTGQKQVSDEDFDKAYEELKAKKDKKKRGIEKPLKGNSMNEETSGDILDETYEQNLLLGVPLELVTSDGKYIPIGHYRIKGEKENDKISLNLYQSHYLIAKIPATETNNDFHEKGINFVKLDPYNENFVKIIFGSLDFNAYAYVQIKTDDK